MGPASPAPRALEQFDKLEDKGTPFDRSVELGPRLNLGPPGPAGARCAASLVRQAQLLKGPRGLVDPATINAQLALAQAHAMEGVNAIGLTPGMPGAYKAEALCRTTVASWARPTRATLKAISSLDEDDPARIPMAYGANFTHLGMLGSSYSPPGLLDPGELYPVGAAAWCLTSLDFATHHDKVMARGFAHVGDSLTFALRGLAIIRHGRPALAQGQYQSLAAWAPRMLEDGPRAVGLILVSHSSAPILAGLQRAVAATFDGFGAPFNGYGDFAMSGSFIGTWGGASWGEAAPPTLAPGEICSSGGLRGGGGQHLTILTQMGTMYNMAGVAFAADGLDKVALGADLARIEPGYACDVKPGVTGFFSGHHLYSCAPSHEPQVREILGQHAQAIEAATVMLEKFPHNKIMGLLYKLVIGRCQSTAAKSRAPGAARATFAGSMGGAHVHNAPLLAVAIARELIAFELARGVASDTRAWHEAVGSLRRGVAAMPGAEADLAELMRGGGGEPLAAVFG